MSLLGYQGVRASLSGCPDVKIKQQLKPELSTIELWLVLGYSHTILVIGEARIDEFIDEAKWG